VGEKPRASRGVGGFLLLTPSHPDRTLAAAFEAIYEYCQPRLHVL